MTYRLDEDPVRAEETRGLIPLKRFGSVADIAGPGLFLLSDAAAFITGAELIVDGGTTALPQSRRRWRSEIAHPHRQAFGAPAAGRAVEHPGTRRAALAAGAGIV